MKSCCNLGLYSAGIASLGRRLATRLTMINLRFLIAAKAVSDKIGSFGNL